MHWLKLCKIADDTYILPPRCLRYVVSLAYLDLRHTLEKDYQGTCSVVLQTLYIQKSLQSVIVYWGNFALPIHYYNCKYTNDSSYDQEQYEEGFLAIS